MEAASARMAARDRFGGFGEPPATPLQRYIQNACDPQNFEPNLALNLEITDLINSKKGNAPREAAIATVNYVNHRNPNVSLLALTLLDICVKNCGYPFHLQISTKEFLNELVRRFPERPPIRYTRVQSKVLELIEEWRTTICQNSKYKDDLGFIRDMHRLLSYKGYAFPEVKREDAAVLNSSDHLRSADEMEEEERAAQSAKLQELIRRGGPQDLQEANKLMKVMAGYDTRHKTDYRAKAAEEVGKIQQKAKLLEEMLQGYKRGDQRANDDVFEELASALASAQPKIQRMCEEESDDTEAVAKLFEINDSIHRTVQRYRLVQKGDLDGAAKIPKGTLGTSGAGVSKGPDNELLLIELGGTEDAPSEPTGSSVTGSTLRQSTLEDDLLGLSMQDTYSGPGGQIFLNSSNGTGSSILDPQPAAIQNAQPRSLLQADKPNDDIFSSFRDTKPAVRQEHGNQFHATQDSNSNSRSHPADPFAALSSFPMTKPPQTQRTEVPQVVHTNKPIQSHPTQMSHLDVQSQEPSAEDEWTFSSALPDHEIIVVNSAIQIMLRISRQSETDNTILIKSEVSNSTNQLISNFTFQLGVVKGYTLKLEPQSGRTLLPLQRAGITQMIRLFGVAAGQGHAVRVRWKTEYRQGLEMKVEQGELNTLGIA